MDKLQPSSKRYIKVTFFDRTEITIEYISNDLYQSLYEHMLETGMKAKGIYDWCKL